MNTPACLLKRLPAKTIFSIAITSLVLFVLSIVLFYASAWLFPLTTQEYLSSVFRSAGKTDWMYYCHPIIVSIALKWFWERYKSLFKGGLLLRALEVSLVYGVVALLPVLWLSFSTIELSLTMVITWMLYGLIQAFTAGLMFAWLNP